MALLEWQNLIFALPMFTALLYVAMMAAGLAMDHDADIGHGPDLDHDIGHVPHLEHDAHLEGDHAHGGDHAPAHPGLFSAVLSFLGIGKVPLSILLMSASMIWGAVGLGLNMAFPDAPIRAVAFAAFATIGGTRLIAQGLTKVLPGEESYHTPKEDLIGQTAEAMFEVNVASGTARLVDPSGNLLDLDCRAAGGERIAAGTRVVLTDYDPSTDLFYVQAARQERGEPS